MKSSRREVLKTAWVASGTMAANSMFGLSQQPAHNQSESLPAAFDKLKPLGDRVEPITAEELQGRMARAQQFMTDAKPPFEALFVTPGTTLVYYTGIRWWPSERILALLVPRQGNPLLVCPAFEEGRLREQLRYPVDVRVWQEDDDPYVVVGKWLGERGIRTGKIAVEETTRYVFCDGLRSAATSLDYVSGDTVTVACRAQKSEHELDLMRLACGATFDVYKATFASLREGLTQREVADMVVRGYERMGLSGEASVFFGPSSALPHGSREEQILRESIGVMIDDGTTVAGYQSDVTRVGVLGKPPAQLQRAFEIVRSAQDAALAAAIAGRACGSVDDAARKVITDAGFGPGYKYFSHRLGHGIGMDGHESPYLVRGNRIILKPGMTFSNEPGIYVVGEYGMRCEDDMVIAESGAAQLLTRGFQPSLEMPIA
ncbi:MAG TPA: Xaa-Pro peptidase family protein [Candidatus Binatus sp.]|nr:Xaa-Pro peptidase family protein [Candidatus Binatus sp.]